MGSLSWGGEWLPLRNNKGFNNSRRKASANNAFGNSSSSFLAKFPLKQAVVAGSLVLTGDVIAQLRSRWIEKNKDSSKEWNYDWVRGLRMMSYGFLLYGPGSQAWYQLLDKRFPAKSLSNLTIKVTLNQVVLGPIVIIVIFGWNSLWQGKLKELPMQYQTKVIPTLVDGWKFWIPATVVNFSVVPLETRVAFMSCCSIFWNFYLSNTMGK